MRSRLHGFSLIEVLAVLLIVALTAGLAMVSLRPLRRQASLQEVLGRVLDYDQGTRLYARRFGQALELEVDREGMQQQCRDRDRPAPRTPLVLPAGFAIEELWIAGGVPGETSITLPVSSEGRSRSYGLCLAGPQGQKRWIVIAGATGQTQVSENDVATQDILQILAQKRLDPP